MKYGPYDNGLIVIGSSQGQLIFFEPVSLSIMLHHDRILPSIKSICFEPLKHVIIVSNEGVVKIMQLEKVKF